MGAIDRALVDQPARRLESSPEAVEALLQERHVLVRIGIEWDNGGVEVEYPYTVDAADLPRALAALVDDVALSLAAEIKEDRGRAGPTR